MRRSVAMLVLFLVGLVACKSKQHGSWDRSHDALCTTVAEYQRDARGVFDEVAKAIEGFPADAERDLAELSRGDSHDSKPPEAPEAAVRHEEELIERIGWLCLRKQDVTELARLQGTLHGLFDVAAVVDSGRPEDVDMIADLVPNELRLRARDVCDITCANRECEHRVARYLKKVDAVRAEEAKIDAGFAKALDQCTKTGWKAHGEPLPALPSPPAGGGSAK